MAEDQERPLGKMKGREIQFNPETTWISFRNVIAIVVVTAVIVGGYLRMTQRLGSVESSVARLEAKLDILLENGNRLEAVEQATTGRDAWTRDHMRRWVLLFRNKNLELQVPYTDEIE